MTIKTTKGDSEGTSLGQSADDVVGFHGLSTSKPTVSTPNGTNDALNSLLSKLENKGIIDAVTPP